ncbi:MAG: acyltransferase [Deltaproteobacteria bacterium]|nr:acyltransferase [Deltaproteobacteria bacterium]
MPLPPLPEPAKRSTRVAALARTVPATGFLFGSLLAFNAAQTASLVMRPLSRRTFRRFNRWAADTWWGWSVEATKILYGTRLEASGDVIPERENAIVLVNHQQMADIPFLLAFARSKGRLGDVKWFAKKSIMYVPGVGWGMWFLDCPFLDRDWTRDQASIGRTFGHLLRDDVPLWLVSFPEGTRLTPQKLEAGRDYAARQGIAPLRHLLLPRTKGFVASVHGLRSHITAVYDLTLGYERGVPTLWQYMKGYSRRAHLHARRYPIETLPVDDAGLAEWLLARFREKDELLERFYATGAFV